MSPFVLYLRSFILMFTKHGRLADLMVGLMLVALGVHWSSPWTVAAGALALFTYSVDLNGMIQRSTLRRVGAFAGKRR